MERTAIGYKTISEKPQLYLRTLCKLDTETGVVQLSLSVCSAKVNGSYIPNTLRTSYLSVFECDSIQSKSAEMANSILAQLEEYRKGHDQIFNDVCKKLNLEEIENAEHS